ncbi:hypothetical protein ANTQUA_LOCUS6351 [Anthophora quadrimaculata]
MDREDHNLKILEFVLDHSNTDRSREPYLRLLRGDCANVVFESVKTAVVKNFLRVALENFEGYTGIITKEFLNLEDASCTMNEPDPCLPLILPPRYRLRDLILGDYAFNDDGER